MVRVGVVGQPRLERAPDALDRVVVGAVARPVQDLDPGMGGQPPLHDLGVVDDDVVADHRHQRRSRIGGQQLLAERGEADADGLVGHLAQEPAGAQVDRAEDGAATVLAGGHDLLASPSGDPGGPHPGQQVDVGLILDLPDGAVVLAEDETHINLLPWVRATWIPRGTRQKVMTPGKNRRRTIFGAVDLRTGRFLCQVTHKAISVSFTAFCEQLLAAYPAAPLVAVVCDNVIIHHSKIVQRWLATHPRIQVLHGARYSPHDNPVERIWGTLKAWLVNNPHPDHPGPRPPSGRLLSPAHPRAAAGARRAAQLPLADRGLRAELQGGRSYRSLMRIFVLVRGVLVVVGEQGALGWGADLPVVPDRGVEGEQALHDAGPQAGGHAAAVVFQAELVLQRPDDRLHALAQPVGEDPRIVLVAGRTR